MTLEANHQFRRMGVPGKGMAKKEAVRRMKRHSHSYSHAACPACGDLDGCHVPAKVRRAPGTANYGQTYPKLVCLVGSSRFKERHEEAMRAETLDGNMVLPKGLYGHLEGVDMGGLLKAMLDELHLRKIDRADEVLVVSVDGYVGESTRRGITYARRHSKPVRWLEEKAKENYYSVVRGD